MKPQTIKNPETAYNGNMIDSLIATVKKVEPKPMPEHTPRPTGGETEIQQIMEGRLGGNASFWNLIPDAPRRNGRAA